MRPKAATMRPVRALRLCVKQWGEGRGLLTRILMWWRGWRRIELFSSATYACMSSQSSLEGLTLSPGDGVGALWFPSR